METKISQISELSNLLSKEDSLNVNLIRLFNRFGLGKAHETAGVDAENSEIIRNCIYDLQNKNITFVVVEHKRQLRDSIVNKVKSN
ncbi:MAG: hypothetical protein LBG96_14845 [Tannerella sp.]|jgi:ABC-type arginine transport system ATPase subunit|nr:hypothetical protein [Tannerella sp.]